MCLNVILGWKILQENHFNKDKNQELSETKVKPQNKQNSIALPPVCFYHQRLCNATPTSCTQVKTMKPMGYPVEGDELGIVPRAINGSTEKSGVSTFAHRSLYVRAFHQRNIIPFEQSTAL